MPISSIIHNAQEFIKLPAEERAWVLVTETGGTAARNLNIENLLLPDAKHVLEGFPGQYHEAVTAAYLAAWQWLLGTDYLMPEGMDPKFMRLSPQGIEWYQRHQRPTAQRPLEFLQGAALPIARGQGVTSELAALLEHAMILNERFTKDLEWSFGSVFLAFLVAADPLSKWFQDYANEDPIRLDTILQRMRITPGEFNGIRRSSTDEEQVKQLVTRKPQLRWSRSAQALFEEAQALAGRTTHTGAALDVRHVMGACIYKPPQANVIELEGWGLNREDWSAAFLTWLTSDFRGEFTQWVTIHLEVFGRNPNVPRVVKSLSRPEAPNRRPNLAADEKERIDTNRFSEQVRVIMQRADQARAEQKKDRVYTEHAVLAMYEARGQLQALADAAFSNFRNFLQQDFGVDSDPPVQFLGLPPISHNLRGALLAAQDKADADGSSSIEESHLLFGVLLQGESTVVQALIRGGVTPDKVKFPSPEQKPPVAQLKPFPDEAASAHIATDSWTLDDRLGHDAYARAIYRFITDEKTEAPLAISIQAPWGGGKTSLMRMVQRELDPKTVRKLEEERERRRDRNRPNPEKVPPEELKQELSSSALLLKHVLSEISDWKKASAGGLLNRPSVPSAAPDTASARTVSTTQKHRVTVWFNAWKYENTQQVWAGLADCILRQVTARMDVIERQRFWLQLQLGRFDADRIRQRIFEKIVAEWWRLAKPWLWGTITLITAFLVAVLSGNHFLQWIGVPGSLISVALGCLKLIRLYANTKDGIEKEPADLSLGEYLRVPNYRANVGFIHEVAEDLNRVLSAIRPTDLPIVVFIDDLDRCSPQKVAEVTEGINLFLAGEFPDCIFVLGMDAEMVAAALDRAHSEVIANLPAYAQGLPVGWRFMDKFVQLPFVIPPPEPNDLTRYVESLLEEDPVRQPIPPEVSGKIENVRHQDSPEAVSRAADGLTEQLKDFNLSAAQQREVVTRLEQVKRLSEIDAEIDRASRDTATVRAFVLQVAPELYRNPRDLKRFLNTFRLHDFLRIARERKKLEAPSRALIADWIRLSLRWPQVVRWMHRLPGNEWGQPPKGQETSILGFRLHQLEDLALEVPGREDINKWTQLLTERLGPGIEGLSWVSDPELFRFFKDMSMRPESERLSYGAGKGLW